MNLNYEKALESIEFYQRHPEYKPFIGDHYEEHGILQVGESHYIGQKADAEKDEFSIQYFDRWWDDPCKDLHDRMDDDPNEGTWGGWYNTRGVISNFIAKRSIGGYNIFANMIRSYDTVFGSGQVRIDDEARKRYHYFAFMNFFQMPALYNGMKFWDSLLTSAKKLDKESLAGKTFDLAAEKSAGIVDKVIEAINPKVIIITSREAAKAYEEHGKYGKNANGPVIIHTVHPCCSWWNRKHGEDNLTGRKRLENKLEEIKAKEQSVISRV